MATLSGFELKPILVFGYGNLSRGDDALGPLLLEYIGQQADAVLGSVDILCDFQLQIEHALDLEHRDLVLFADASVACTQAFAFAELSPVRDDSYTTHAMSPAAVLAVYQTIKKQPPPPCFLLSIKGERFELGEGLSVGAQGNLTAACRFAQELLADVDVAAWRQLVSG
ncbi:MAG: hydrogenase maturation protease [Methylovulum sp.]|nr:hydrogenase maturation protease [Methylovulum sp.]